MIAHLTHSWTKMYGVDRFPIGPLRVPKTVKKLTFSKTWSIWGVQRGGINTATLLVEKNTFWLARDIGSEQKKSGFSRFFFLFLFFLFFFLDWFQFWFIDFEILLRLSRQFLQLTAIEGSFRAYMHDSLESALDCRFAHFCRVEKRVPDKIC